MIKKIKKIVVGEFENILNSLCEELSETDYCEILKAVGELVDECREGHGITERR